MNRYCVLLSAALVAFMPTFSHAQKKVVADAILNSGKAGEQIATKISADMARKTAVANLAGSSLIKNAYKLNGISFLNPNKKIWMVDGTTQIRMGSLAPVFSTMMHKIEQNGLLVDREYPVDFTKHGITFRVSDDAGQNWYYAKGDMDDFREFLDAPSDLKEFIKNPNIVKSSDREFEFFTKISDNGTVLYSGSKNGLYFTNIWQSLVTENLLQDGFKVAKFDEDTSTLLFEVPQEVKGHMFKSPNLKHISDGICRVDNVEEFGFTEGLPFNNLASSHKSVFPQLLHYDQAKGLDFIMDTDEDFGVVWFLSNDKKYAFNDLTKVLDYNNGKLNLK